MTTDYMREAYVKNIVMDAEADAVMRQFLRRQFRMPTLNAESLAIVRAALDKTADEA